MAYLIAYDRKLGCRCKECDKAIQCMAKPVIHCAYFIPKIERERHDIESQTRL